MMKDDERREVARRLRGNPEDSLIPHRTGRHHGMGCHEAADRFWNMCDRIKAAGNYDIAFSTTSVLADLIEPMDSGSAEGAGSGIPKCDRDALLELADDLERMGNGSMYDASISDEYGIARRIREACGEAV